MCLPLLKKRRICGRGMRNIKGDRIKPLTKNLIAVKSCTDKLDWMNASSVTTGNPAQINTAPKPLKIPNILVKSLIVYAFLSNYALTQVLLLELNFAK